MSGQPGTWKMPAVGAALVLATALAGRLMLAGGPGGPPDPLPAGRVVAEGAPAPSLVACSERAAREAGVAGSALEVVKRAALGAVIGAAVGAAGGVMADGEEGANAGAALGGMVGMSGGALTALEEHRKRDERYRRAYARCAWSQPTVG